MQSECLIALHIFEVSHLEKNARYENRGTNERKAYEQIFLCQRNKTASAYRMRRTKLCMAHT